MPESAAESLRLINARLRRALSSWQPAGEPLTIVPTVFTGLLTELRHAQYLLEKRSPPSEANRELEAEIAEYSQYVRQMQKVLPAIRERLLVEKGRMENARSHLAAASAWADARKKTL